MLAIGTGPVRAAVESFEPQRDDEVLQRLPALAPWQQGEREVRAALRRQPKDAASALAASRYFLDIARTQGDARYAGQAAGALRAWPDSDAAPVEVLLMRAEVAQYLHEFSKAEQTLQAALVKSPSQRQAWLTLAAIQRLQGRYAAANQACERLGREGAAFHAKACLAEGQALVGDFAGARATLRGLLLGREVREHADLGAAAWVVTTLAQLEERAGQDEAAVAYYRQLLALRDPQADAGSYGRLSFADLLIRRGHHAEARELLLALPKSDTVLLRLAIAARGLSGTARSPEATELAKRIAASKDRGGNAHAREEARFLLDVQGRPEAALNLARINVGLQREPEDLLLLARCAVAARSPAALEEARRLLGEIGLKDARIDSLL